MSTTAKPLYGSVAALTITLASLAASATAGRQSTVIDNTTDLAVDAIVQCKITTGTTPTVNTLIEIWAFGTGDGTNYSGGAGASDAGLTPTVKPTMKLLETIQVSASSNIAYHSGPHSIQNAFGGTMPRKWGIWVLNNTAVALNSTCGNHVIQYTPVQYQSV